MDEVWTNEKVHTSCPGGPTLLISLCPAGPLSPLCPGGPGGPGGPWINLGWDDDNISSLDNSPSRPGSPFSPCIN